MTTATKEDRKRLAGLVKELYDICKGTWGPTREQLLEMVRQALVDKNIEPLRDADPETRWNQVSAELEELPIHHTDGMPPKWRWMYFVLCDGEWWPCTGGEISNHLIYGPTLNYRITYEGGAESGPALAGHWAHCSVDHTPCLPYKYDLDS